MAKKQRSVYLEDEVWNEVLRMAADSYAADVARVQRGELAIDSLHYTSSNDILRAAIAAYAPQFKMTQGLAATGMINKVSTGKRKPR